MQIYPAIDILGGKAVRLTQGDYSKYEVFADNPVDILQQFVAKGSQNLHTVDLDGAKDGSLTNFATIKQLVAQGKAFIQVGGGIRDEDRIKRYLDIGVGRVILGTAAIRNFAFAVQMSQKYIGKVAVGVDARDGFVAIDGWQTTTKEPSFEFCQRCAKEGINTIIYTDIATDGAMAGTNMQAFRTLKQIEGLNIIASGGISSESELADLQKLDVYGAILGKSLYKGLIDLSKAINIGRGVV